MLAARSAVLRVLLSGFMVTTPLASAMAQTPSAVDALTPQSIAAITLRPAAIAQSPLAAMYPIEVAEAATDDFLGLPLEAIQRVTAVIDPLMGATPQYAVIVDTTQPIDFERFRNELTRHTKPGELLGRPLLESQQEPLPSLCLINDQKLAIGPRLFLKRYVRGLDASNSPLAAEMQAAGGEQNHLHAVVLLEPIRPLIELALMGAKQDADIPPEAHKFLDAALLLNRVVLTANVSNDRGSSLTVYTDDKDSADQITAMIDEGAKLLREKMLQDDEFQKLRAHPEAVVRAWGAYVDRMIDGQGSYLAQLREGDDAFVLGRVEAGDGALVTTATIGVLVALLLPAVQAAREAARRTSSMNNMKQIGIAMFMHESRHSRFPAQAIKGPDGEPLLSWRVAVLPDLGGEALYNRFHLDEPWDSPHNKTLLAEMPEYFLDPTSPGLEASDGKTHYLAVSGKRTMFDSSRDGIRLAEVTDGLSNTIMLVQVDDAHAVEWTRPIDYDAAANSKDPVAGIGSLHPGVFLAGMGDGSIRNVPLDTDRATLLRLFAIDDGKPVDLP